MTSIIPISTVLWRLTDRAPANQFTICWLLGNLNTYGFGIVLLLLAMVGMVPGVCVLAAFLLIVPAFEMVSGRIVPTFPRQIVNRPLPTRYLINAVRGSNPLLLHLEKVIHPRWRIPPWISKRIVGAVVLLMAILLILPIPMIQVIPASIIATIALAYLEDDGLFITISAIGALAAFAIAATAIWNLIPGFSWLRQLL